MPIYCPVFGVKYTALEEAGYDVKRADSFLDQQNILRDIVRGIAEADLVVAELTGLNINVLYELGLCHGLRIPTVLLAQSMEDVPFDLRPYRIQVYSTRFDQVHALKQALTEIAQKHGRNEISFGSPVIDFLPIERGLQIAGDSVTAMSDGVPTSESEEDAKGIFDHLITLDGAAAEIVQIMTTLTTELNELGTFMTEQTKEVATIAGNPGAVSRAHKIATNVSEKMNNSRYAVFLKNRINCGYETRRVT